MDKANDTDSDGIHKKQTKRKIFKFFPSFFNRKIMSRDRVFFCAIKYKILFHSIFFLFYTYMFLFLEYKLNEYGFLMSKQAFTEGTYGIRT